MGFVEMIETLESYGVADVLLPFLLIFTIVFAILQKTKILGVKEDKVTPHKNFNSMVALVLALAVVIPHVLGRYPPGSDVVDIMNSALPNISVVIVAILMVMLIMGLIGWDYIGLKGNNVSGWIVMAALAIVTYIFGASAGWWEKSSWLGFLFNEETKTLITIILIFGVIIWFITREEPKKGADGKRVDKTFFENVGELFNKQ